MFEQGVALFDALIEPRLDDASKQAVPAAHSFSPDYNARTLGAVIRVMVTKGVRLYALCHSPAAREQSGRRGLEKSCKLEEAW